MKRSSDGQVTEEVSSDLQDPIEDLEAFSAVRDEELRNTFSYSVFQQEE